MSFPNFARKENLEKLFNNAFVNDVMNLKIRTHIANKLSFLLFFLKMPFFCCNPVFVLRLKLLDDLENHTASWLKDTFFASTDPSVLICMYCVARTRVEVAPPRRFGVRLED